MILMPEIQPRRSVREEPVFFFKLVYSYIANKIQYEQQLSITSSNITSDYECFII